MPIGRVDPLHLSVASFAEMRAPRALGEALRRAGCPAGRVFEVAAEDLPAGYSAARLTRLRVRVEPPGSLAVWQASVILKALRPFDGWLSWASADARLREIQLWRAGLLAELPALLATGTLASATIGPPEAPAAGVLLLRDVRGHLLPRATQAPPGHPPLLVRLLDALARLHAAYWEDVRLADPALGLAPIGEALLLAAPATVAARLAAGDRDPYLATIPAGWEAFLALAPPTASAALRAVLADPSPVVTAVERLPTTLVHGDVWGPNLGTLPPARRPDGARTGRRILLLDWALATAGPCTYDPLWLCGTWHALDPRDVLARYRARLARQLRARGRQLDPATWHDLADVGYLRTVLVCGEAFGRAAAHSPMAARRARWWAARGARAAERLGHR
jgi:hypothetical protein